MFHETNNFQNGANALSKIDLENVLSKPQFPCILNHTILFQLFHKHVVQIFLRNEWKDFRLPMPAPATATRKSFNLFFSF